MILDIIAILAMLGLIWIGFRLGLWRNLIATGLLVASILGGLALQRAGVLPAGWPVPGLFLSLGAWAGCMIFAWLLMRRGAKRSVGGAALGLVQAAAVVVFAAGTLSQVRPAIAEARVYPAVAVIGPVVTERLPDADLTFPDPPVTAPEPETPDAPPRPVEWAEAMPFEAAPVRHLPGTIQAADRAPLGFEVEGRVQRVAVEIGDTFAAGDVLATLETTPLRIALDQENAALIEAEAQAAEARLDYDRQSTLYDRGVVSAAARDAARATLDSTESRLAVARTRVEDAEDRLSESDLIAPYAGQVAERLIEPAQLYRPGTAAFEVQSSEGGYEIEVTVPETIISRLAIGTDHPARLLDGSGTAFDARLTEIASRANRSSGFPVVLTVSEAPAALRAGMAAEVGFRLAARSDAMAETPVIVPLRAVAVGQDGARHVFVIDPAAEIAARRTVTLAGTEGEGALIASGLATGEIVATAGLPFLSDGMPVALMNTGIARFDP